MEQFTYNMVGDFIGFIICILIFIMLHINNIKGTIQYKYLFKINLFNYFVCFNNIIYYFVQSNFDSDFLLFTTSTYYYLFSLLAMIYSYLYVLTLIPKCAISMQKIEKWYLAFFSPVYILYVINVFKNIIFDVKNGVFIPGPLSHLMYYVYGLTIFFVCITIFIIRKNEISKNIAKHSLLFIPLLSFCLLIQFLFPEIQLGGFTSSMVGLMYFLLFHSKSLDVISGGLKEDSFSFEIKNIIKKKEKSTIITLKILDYDFYARKYSSCDVNKKIFYLLKKFENINIKNKVFNEKKDVYTFILYGEKIADSMNLIIEKAKEINATELLKFNNVDSLHFKTIILNFPNNVKNEKEYKYIREVACKKCEINDFYNIEVEDFVELEQQEEIINTINDIVSKNDYNDSRVQVYYQPIHNNKTNSIETLEALIRLEINDKIIYPDKFISILEETENIHKFSCIVLSKVCMFLKELKNQNIDIKGISVNISIIELKNPNFVNNILSIIKNNNINPNQILLELTESMTFDENTRIISIMNELIDNGILFYLDDFGVGHSNISRLINFPFKTIKFDKSLIFDSIENKDSYDIISSISKLFKSKGFEILLEGIEGLEHCEIAKEVEADYSQGYFYSKPLSKDNVISFLTLYNNTKLVIENIHNDNNPLEILKIVSNY